MAGPSDEKKPWRPPVILVSVGNEASQGIAVALTRSARLAPGLRPAAKPSAAHFLFFLFTKNISERGGGHFPTKARALHGGHKLFAAFSLRDKLFGGLAADFTFVKFLKK